MRATVVRFGPPADERGDIFIPGSIDQSAVPVCADFDHNMVVGRAIVHADGTADINGIEVDPELITIGYRVREAYYLGEARFIERAEIVCLGWIRSREAHAPDHKLKKAQ